MAHLYINPKGEPVTVSSYSSGALFDECPKKYELAKLRGWRRKGKKASLKFGICVEEALMFFHNNGCKPGTGVDEFKRRWLTFKDDTELSYTAKEGDWKDLYSMGAAMLRLYGLRLPSLPIVNPSFQINYKREVFPGTEYAGIEHTAFIDMVSRAPWVHPLLPRTTIPAGAAHQPALIDIKTSSTPLGDAAEMLALDPQLREYAWTAKFSLIGFLWFVKARPGYDKGTSVSLLESSGIFTAGDEAVVVYVQKPDSPEPPADPEKPKRKSSKRPKEPITEERVGLVPHAAFDKFEEAAKDLRGKALEEFKKAFVLENGSLVLPEHVTKVKVQFAATRVSDEDMAEAAQNVGRQIVEIVNCNKTGVWPKKPSVRFPLMKCPMCEMRGICLNKPALRDQMLVQISPAEKESDWIDDFENTD